MDSCGAIMSATIARDTAVLAGTRVTAGKTMRECGKSRRFAVNFGLSVKLSECKMWYNEEDHQILFHSHFQKTQRHQ